VLLTKSLIKNKKINKGGSIVFMSSVAAMSSDIGNAVYGMSKSALQAFSGYCALELAAKRIRVNSVHPGAVETNMICNGVLSEEDRQKDVLRYPLGRYGKPEDIAWAIIYLLSDASSWVTGTQLVIDGGFLLN
jgi:NAD(P)-dependent dehydrogenase (short-subunit alcohol dehydrogenase family)